MKRISERTSDLNGEKRCLYRLDAYQSIHTRTHNGCTIGAHLVVTNRSTNTVALVSGESLLNGFCRNGRHCFSGHATSHDEN